MGSTVFLRVGGTHYIGRVRYAARATRAGPFLAALCQLGSPWLPGIYKWVFGTLGLLDDFVEQVVVVRRGSGLHRWAGWLREDLGTWTSCLARARFCTSLPISSSRMMWLRLLRSWMPHFWWSGHPVVTVDQELDFVIPFFPREDALELPRITGQDLFEVARLFSMKWWSLLGIGLRVC